MVRPTKCFVCLKLTFMSKVWRSPWQPSVLVLRLLKGTSLWIDNRLTIRNCTKIKNFPFQKGSDHQCSLEPADLACLVKLAKQRYMDIITQILTWMIIAKYSANKRCMFLTVSVSKNSFWKRPGMGTLRELYPEEEEVAQNYSFSFKCYLKFNHTRNIF